MRRTHATIYSAGFQRELDVLVFGHDGLPVLVFPSSQGRFYDYEDFGMVAALRPWLDRGALRLYCVDSADSETWYAHHRPVHERAWRHQHYEQWIMGPVLEAIGRDVGDGTVRPVVTGCSFGAYHAANFALKHPHRFPLALCLSGVYDIRSLLEGHYDDWVYFNNPLDYLRSLHGDPLEAARRQTFINIVCGQGQWEGPMIASSHELRNVLAEKQVPNYLDLWGHDVAHDWPWWRRQITWYVEQLVQGGPPWRRT